MIVVWGSYVWARRKSGQPKLKSFVQEARSNPPCYPWVKCFATAAKSASSSSSCCASESLPCTRSVFLVRKALFFSNKHRNLIVEWCFLWALRRPRSLPRYLAFKNLSSCLSLVMPSIRYRSKLASFQNDWVSPVRFQD